MAHAFLLTAPGCPGQRYRPESVPNIPEYVGFPLAAIVSSVVYTYPSVKQAPLSGPPSQPASQPIRLYLLFVCPTKYQFDVRIVRIQHKRGALDKMMSATA